MLVPRHGMQSLPSVPPLAAGKWLGLGFFGALAHGGWLGGSGKRGCLDAGGSGFVMFWAPAGAGLGFWQRVGGRAFGEGWSFSLLGATCSRLQKRALGSRCAGILGQRFLLRSGRAAGEAPCFRPLSGPSCLQVALSCDAASVSRSQFVCNVVGLKGGGEPVTHRKKGWGGRGKVKEHEVLQTGA